MGIFTDKLSLVTGAGSGIGRAIALALAREGALVALVGRAEAKLEGTARTILDAGGRAVGLPADLGDERQVRELSARLEGDHGGPDILVHGAGAYRMGSLKDASLEDLDEMYRVNVRAPFLLTQLLLPLLKEHQGQIVFVNSSAGLAAGGRWIGYSATKGALKLLADGLRAEVNADGIRVLSVFPGRTATPLQEEVHRLEGRPYVPERLIQPEDVAGLVVHALALPRTAEVTDILVRPAAKP